MKIGYVRVSDETQNEGRQIWKMKEIGIEERFIFVDKITGVIFERPQLQSMLQIIREGDIVYFEALDRLGRDYDGIIENWKLITRKLKADIVILENVSLFDSRKYREMGDFGKMLEDQFLSLLAFGADQERKRIKRRQREGIENARREGKHLGRPRITLDTLSKFQHEILERQYPRWKAKEITAVSFMDEVGLKKDSFYKIIKEFEKRKSELIVD
jgi:DNA invertase Pin-like site-specific DNA recombinase